MKIRCQACELEKDESEFRLFARSGRRAKSCRPCADVWRKKYRRSGPKRPYRLSGVDIDAIHYKLGAVRRP